MILDKHIHYILTSISAKISKKKWCANSHSIDFWHTIVCVKIISF